MVGKSHMFTNTHTLSQPRLSPPLPLSLLSGAARQESEGFSITTWSNDRRGLPFSHWWELGGGPSPHTEGPGERIGLAMFR